MTLQSPIARSPRCSTFRFVICGFILCVSMCCNGCRTGMGTFTGMQEEPSFDRLIELESTAADNSSTSHPQVARRRPGTNTAESRFESTDGDELAESSNEIASQPLSTTNVSSARRRITDDSAHDEVDGPLADADPSAQLLRRTQLALDNARQEPPAPTVNANKSTRGNQIAAQPPNAQNHNTNRSSRSVQQPAFTSEDDSEDTVEFRLSQDDNRSEQLTDSDLPKQPIEAATYRNETGPAVDQAVFKSAAARPGDSDTDRSSSQADELSWEQHLREALRQLETTSADPLVAPAQAQNRHALIARLLALSLQDRDMMLKKVDGLQPKEQDYLNHQLTALYDAFDPEANPVSGKRWSLVMLSQRKASDELAALSNLEINNLSFCTDVESFGVIAKFADYKFTADQEVLLYCELDNFVSEKSKDGKGFETQLQGSYEVVDASGKRVADQSLPLDSHVCRNKRRDYFIAYRIYIPQKIEPGKYSLKLTVEDLKGHKFGQAQIPFQVQ